jgi:hypothetical protein
MKLSSNSTVLSTLFLTSTPLLVIAAPTSAANILLARAEDWRDVRHCFPSDQFDICTAYFATSDEDIIDYRTAAIYRNDCRVLQAVKVTKTMERITLRGSLSDPVNLRIDTSAILNGYIYYKGVDTQFGALDKDNRMQCHHPKNADGTGCRITFNCA